MIKIGKYKYLLISAVLVVLVSSLVNASNPVSPILPSDNIQDPGNPESAWGGCGPTDSNCYITGDWSHSGSNIYYNTGNIGVGTNNPDGMLSIFNLATPTRFLSIGNNQVNGHYLTLDDHVFKVGAIDTGGAVFTVDHPNTKFTFMNGSVGIGTSTPSYTLDVSGTANISSTVTVGATTISPSSGILQSNIGNTPFPGVLRANSTNSFAMAPVTSTSVAASSGFDGHQVQQCTWSASVATCTLRSGQTNNWVAGSWVNVSGMSGYNGSFPTTAVTSTTFSFALSSNPGTVTVSYGLVYLEPEIQVQAKSPFGSAAVFIANPNCVPNGHDATDPIISAIGGDGNVNNYSWYVGCDGHSVSFRVGSILKAFQNGLVDQWTSEHLLAWGNSTSATPASSANMDTGISRLSAGKIAIGTGAAGSVAGTLVAANIGASNSSPGYLLHVGSASSGAFTVARFQNSGGTCDVLPATAGGITCTSDERLKKNIINLSDETLDKVLSMRLVNYNLLSESDGTPLHAGVIAQELEQIFPELVATDPTTGYKSVAYAGLVPYALKAIQELNIKISPIPNFQDQSLANKVSEFLRGIADGIASIGKVQTKELCVDDVCVTRDQFKNMLEKTNTMSAPQDLGPALFIDNTPEPEQPQPQVQDPEVTAS